MNNIVYIIIGMFVLDLILTYINANKYKKLFPEKDYTNIELNPIVKGLWKNFGLIKGGIVATIIQILILLFVINYLGYTFLLILLGIYLTIILIHIDNFSLINEKIREKKNKPKKKEKNWRKYAVIIILLLGFIDLCLTFYYITTYNAWQPGRAFSDMENNPLLVFLWDNLGLVTGMIAGFLIILPLQYLVVKKAHWVITLMLFAALSFALVNHYNNINLIHELIKLYPLGYS